MKIGDKLQSKFTNNIVEIVDFNVYLDTVVLKWPDGILTSASRNYLHTNFTLITNTTNDNKSDDTSGLPLGTQSNPVSFDPVVNGFNYTPPDVSISPWGGGIYTFPTSGDYTVSPTYKRTGESLEFTFPGFGPFAKITKCDCGSAKTYGEQCGPDMHSSWCAIMQGKK